MKSALVKLQDTRWHPVLSLAATVGLTARRRSPTVVHRDRDGDWANRQSEATFYSTRYSSVRYREIHDKVVDHWCHAYRIAPGDTVIDVGAGVGDEAVVLSRMVGPAGRLVAIEAHPATFRCLRKTVEANGLDNVLALNVAIGAEDGELAIEDRSHHKANRVGRSGAMRVRAITLDHLLEEHGLARIDLVKINIEGAETAVLRGAGKALGIVRHWVVSCHDFMANVPGFEHSATQADVLELLRQAGMRIHDARSEDPRPWVAHFVYASRPS